MRTSLTVRRGRSDPSSEATIRARIGLSALILVFTVYLLRRLVAPVRRVGSAADDLAVGDPTARAPERGGPELDARNLELADAKKEADRANQAKSEFLSRMSHELRTPLNAVLGFAQLLEVDDLSDDQHESVQQIACGGRHLLQLIDEVLDISQVETGELRLSPEPTNVAELIEEMLSLVAPLAEQRSIRLVADFGGRTDGHVLADGQRLKQILLNLLSNAIKYNREAGEVRVSLRTSASERIGVSVTDTGAGLSQEQLSKLFEPFERLGAEHRDVEGTGLGLALSRRLAEAMGGTIEVQSAPGQGSTFSVHLPAAPAPAPAEAPDEHVAQRLDVVGPRLHDPDAGGA